MYFCDSVICKKQSSSAKKTAKLKMHASTNRNQNTDVKKVFNCCKTAIYNKKPT